MQVPVLGAQVRYRCLKLAAADGAPNQLSTGRAGPRLQELVALLGHLLEDVGRRKHGLQVLPGALAGHPRVHQVLPRAAKA